MLIKPFAIFPNYKVERCPVCKNRTIFVTKIEMRLYNEYSVYNYDIWIICGKCNYDPSIFSQIKTPDIWGEVKSVDQLQEIVLNCWNKGILFAVPKVTMREQAKIFWMIVKMAWRQLHRG